LVPHKFLGDGVMKKTDFYLGVFIIAHFIVIVPPLFYNYIGMADDSYFFERVDLYYYLVYLITSVPIIVLLIKKWLAKED